VQLVTTSDPACTARDIADVSALHA
jgi:hypothetical protein